MVYCPKKIGFVLILWVSQKHYFELLYLISRLVFVLPHRTINRTIRVGGSPHGRVSLLGGLSLLCAGLAPFWGLGRFLSLLGLWQHMKNLPLASLGSCCICSSRAFVPPTLVAFSGLPAQLLTELITELQRNYKKPVQFDSYFRQKSLCGKVSLLFRMHRVHRWWAQWELMRHIMRVPVVANSCNRASFAYA